MHGSSGRATCSLNSVSGHLHLSHKNLGLTDPLISATDSDHEQAGKRDGSNGMITKLEKDEEGWAVMSQCTALLNPTRSSSGLVRTLASVHALRLIPTITCPSISNSVPRFGS